MLPQGRKTQLSRIPKIEEELGEGYADGVAPDEHHHIKVQPEVRATLLPSCCCSLFVK